VKINTALTLVSTSQVAVQKKLLKYAKERRDGTREGSMITVESVESLSRGEKEMWRNIRKDLEDIGISVEAFNANKGFILRWLQEALQSDVMEERSDGTQNVLENAPDSDGGSPVQPQDEGQECSSDASQCLDETGSRSTESPMRKDTEPSSPRGGTSSIATTLVTWLLRRYNQGFIAACDCSDLKSAEKLLKKGADINTQYHNQSALYRAAMRGDEGVVKWLFENKIGYKYAPEDYIYEPLVVAAKFGFTDVARIILSHVNVAEFSCRGQWHAALYEAVVCGKVETVNLLLDRGADVEAVLKAPSLSAGASLGSTPNKTLLQLAAAHGHVAVTNCLLDHGAKTHGRVADGKLAFSIAIEEGHFMVAKALLERTLDIDTKSASQNDIPEPTNNWLALRWLKDRGWIPNIGDSRILLGIIKNGDDETAYLLIEHGASIDFTDKLLSEAFEYGCHRALKLMLKKWRPDKVLSLQFLSSAGA